MDTHTTAGVRTNELGFEVFADLGGRPMVGTGGFGDNPVSVQDTEFFQYEETQIYLLPERSKFHVLMKAVMMDNVKHFEGMLTNHPINLLTDVSYVERRRKLEADVRHYTHIVSRGVNHLEQREIKIAQDKLNEAKRDLALLETRHLRSKGYNRYMAVDFTHNRIDYRFVFGLKSQYYGFYDPATKQLKQYRTIERLFSQVNIKTKGKKK